MIALEFRMAMILVDSNIFCYKFVEKQCTLTHLSYTYYLLHASLNTVEFPCRHGLDSTADNLIRLSKTILVIANGVKLLDMGIEIYRIQFVLTIYYRRCRYTRNTHCINSMHSISVLMQQLNADKYSQSVFPSYQEFYTWLNSKHVVEKQVSFHRCRV